MAKIHVVDSDILDPIIGTQVRKGMHQEFTELLIDGILNHDPSGDRAPGQHFIMLPPEATNVVSAGVGRRQSLPAQCYVVREWRGRCEMFLKRQYAAEAEKVAVIVYDIGAYGADPDVTPEELKRLEEKEATHVLVAILAFAGPESPPTPFTFVRNVAGANNAYEELTFARQVYDEVGEDECFETKVGMGDDVDCFVEGGRRTVRKLSSEAKAIIEYHTEWCVVAD
jgi:hypothetical protein